MLSCFHSFLLDEDDSPPVDDLSLFVQWHYQQWITAQYNRHSWSLYLIVSEIPLLTPVSMAQIWSEIIFWKVIDYSEINSDWHAKNICVQKYKNYSKVQYATSLPYFQAGWHELVDYKYIDLVEEFWEFITLLDGKYQSTMSCFQYFCYNKIKNIVHDFEISDYFGVRKQRENYILRLQSMITVSDMSLENVETRIFILDEYFWLKNTNVCFHIHLNEYSDNFVPSTWQLSQDANSKGYNWVKKVPTCVKPCTMSV